MKSILILDAFISDKVDEGILSNFIDSSKTISNDVLLMSNTKISEEIQDKVNYFFYDKRNQLFGEEYDNYEIVNYYTHYGNFKVSNIFPHTQPHALSVLISLFRSVKIAKELGYTHFIKMEYDAIIGEETKTKLEKIVDECLTMGKKGIFYVNEHSSMSVHYFLCEIDYFLNNFWNITCEQDYIDYLRINYNNRDFQIMEKFMAENVKRLNPNDVLIFNNFYEEFSDTLWNSKASRVYYDKKYKECVTKFYLNVKNPDEVVIYSKNVKSTPDFRKIVVKFNDGTEREIIHEFDGYGVWIYNLLPNNIEKMMIYDKDGLFLYEDYFDNIKNEIEFF